MLASYIDNLYMCGCIQYQVAYFHAVNNIFYLFAFLFLLLYKIIQHKIIVDAAHNVIAQMTIITTFVTL